MGEPEPERCRGLLLYRGRTRAKCHFDAGHAGRHHNGTVWWADDHKGATYAP